VSRAFEQIGLGGRQWCVSVASPAFGVADCSRELIRGVSVSYLESSGFLCLLLGRRTQQKGENYEEIQVVCDGGDGRRYRADRIRGVRGSVETEAFVRQNQREHRV